MSRSFVESTGLQELAHTPHTDIRSVWAEGVSPTTGHEYDYVFVFEHPKGHYIKIDSEARQEFLKKGTEEEAQVALIGVAQATRRISGGAFDIHPFYGAVWGTKLETVAPDFLTDLARPDEDLTMIVNLTDAGSKFDDASTREAMAIGTTVVIPSAAGDRMLRYMQAPKANPNQRNRDQAITNGLGARWDAEFAKFNISARFGKNRIPKAMEMNPQNIANLLRRLGQSGVLTEIDVTAVHTQSELDATLKRISG